MFGPDGHIAITTTTIMMIKQYVMPPVIDMHSTQGCRVAFRHLPPVVAPLGAHEQFGHLSLNESSQPP